MDSAPPAPPIAVDCAKSALTWTNFGEGFVSNWCTGCHSSHLVTPDTADTGIPFDPRHGAPPDVNFDDYAHVVQWADRMNLRVTADMNQMPPAGGVPEIEKLEFHEWVTCGLPGGTTPVLAICDQPIAYYQGDVTIATQADADAIAGTYTGISGNLTIVDGDAASALSATLCQVGGDLTASAGSHGALSLAVLETVGGKLALDGAGLESASMPKLASLGGALSITATPSLQSFDLAKLSILGGPLTISDNAALVEADIGYVSIVPQGDLSVERNTSLERLYLDRVATVAGSVVVQDDPSLTDLTGTDDFESIGQDLRIANLPALAQLNNFDYLTSIGGDIELTGLGGLVNLRGFGSLGALDGHVWIRDNGSLANVAAFPNLISVGHELSIEDDPVLEAFDDGGFLLLQSVGALGTPGVDADLSFVNDPELGYGGFDVQTQNNTCGADDAVPNAFDDVATLGGLRISGDGFAALPEMPCLTSIAGDLRVEGEPGLIVIQDDVTDPIDVPATPFPALTSIGGDLSIASNDVLVDVAGLTGIQSIGADFSVVDNPALPTSDANALRDAIGLANIGGTVTISGNGP